MKTRPKGLTALALILLGMAIGLGLLSRLSVFQWQWQWAVIGLSLLLVPLALRASTQFLILTPVFLAAMTWANWKLILAHFQTHAFPWSVHILTLGVVLCFAGVLLSPSCRRALLEPGSRWWLTPPRMRIGLDLRLCPVMGGELSSKTFDLSRDGAFVDLADARWKSPLKKSLSVGTYCWVRVGLNEVSAFTCTAEVVRLADARGAYPQGAGLRFVGLAARERKVLRGFLRSLEIKPPLDALVPRAAQI